MLRGHLDSIMLCLINEEDRYGYELFSEICERTGGKLAIKEATLYATLQRLEKQGYITSYQGIVSSGGKRRYYHITPTGQELLGQAIAQWREAREMINIFLEDDLNERN